MSMDSSPTAAEKLKTDLVLILQMCGNSYATYEINALHTMDSCKKYLFILI